MIALIALFLGSADGGDEAIVIRAGRILTGTGEEIRDGVILITAGKIRRVGKEVDIPKGARPIDASTKTVIPGLVDGASTLGIEGSANEHGREVTPELHILDMVDPSGRDLTRARQSGITTALVEPGNRSVVGGLASVIKTAGISRSGMTIRGEAALKAAMGAGPTSGNYSPRGSQATLYARRPTTRMGVVWEFKKAFLDAKERENSLLRRCLDGSLPVRVAASRATDIESVVKLADELGLSIVLEEAEEAYKIADLLVAKKVPVLLRPEFSALDGSEGSEIHFDAFRRLREKGVRVALLPAQSDDPESLLGAATLAVKYGTTREDALRAVTLWPAEILRVSDRVGSLEEGKDADLVILSGDPLEQITRIEAVLINGKTVYSGRQDP